MRLNRKPALSAVIVSGLMFGHISPAPAANWLMLQGTEKPQAAAKAKLWGFIQGEYQHDFSDGFTKPDGTEVYVPPKLIGPDLDDQSSFNVRRARIGVRGANFPLDGKTNYFLLAELGNNGITKAGDSFAKVTDASVTFNHIPGARVRMGVFKYPGAEEGLQAVPLNPWINFTSVTNQLLLERFSTQDASAAGANRGGAAPTPKADLNLYDKSVGAFRDVGVQVFDSFGEGDWEHSYALMLGNGNGLNTTDDNEAKDTYLYWSSARVLGGEGPRREDLKFFAWHQDGERNFYAQDGSTEAFDRTRYGLGFAYREGPWRLRSEYMQGEGMIFQGPNNPDKLGNDFEAAGWYVEGGWFIPGSRWELDLRFDTYTRNKDESTESTFDTWTAGAQYHFNKKTRVAVQYASRDFGSEANAIDNQLDGVKGRLAVQVTAIY